VPEEEEEEEEEKENPEVGECVGWWWSFFVVFLGFEEDCWFAEELPNPTCS